MNEHNKNLSAANVYFDDPLLFNLLTTDVYFDDPLLLTDKDGNQFVALGLMRGCEAFRVMLQECDDVKVSVDARGVKRIDEIEGGFRAITRDGKYRKVAFTAGGEHGGGVWKDKSSDCVIPTEKIVMLCIRTRDRDILFKASAK